MAIQPEIEHIMALAGRVGCSLGAIHHGRIIHTAHFGYRDLAQKTPPNDDTIYPICSLSKSMTAATVGILVDEGALTWDTKIVDVLDDFKIEYDAMRMNITLVDMLSHRSRLQETNMWPGSQNNILFPASNAINVISSLKLAHPFRAAWECSNYGYELIAQVIYKTLGMKWHQVISDRVLKPLNLKPTGFDADFGSHDNVALAYATLDDTSPVLIQDPKLGSETILGAGGGVRSSIRDMLEFYRVLLVSGSDQQKSGKTSAPGSPFRQVREQFSSHIQLSGPKYSQTGYGFGLARVQLPGSMGAIGTNPTLYPDMPIVGRGSPSRLALYHQGTLAGAFATVILFPETDSGVVVLTNSLPLNESDDWIGQLITETIFDVKGRNDYVTSGCHGKLLQCTAQV
ncbi:beta-lactamase/transpeptidase-like protein [Cadophora sp. DSE1049]|nr:beta-lactamase/transpeptidase-like protein [Cadophora sp. DSE1049]